MSNITINEFKKKMENEYLINNRLSKMSNRNKKIESIANKQTKKFFNARGTPELFIKFKRNRARGKLGNNIISPTTVTSKHVGGKKRKSKSVRCTAKTKSGTRCKHHTTHGKKCGHHRK